MFNVWVEAGEDHPEICMRTGFPLPFLFRIVGRKHQKVKCDISSASYSNMHGFKSLGSYVWKSLPPGSKKQLFITFSLMGLINLCDLRKAAELKRNLNSVVQLQVQHEIEVPVHAPRICPHVLPSWGLGQVFHLTMLSSSQWVEWCHQGAVEVQSPYRSCLWPFYKLSGLARHDVFPFLKCCQWHGIIWSTP